ncbi:hypothetical protein F4861DRAFT_535858 [Xylaria intraflava]|nr:hypothetical protein F4861DRAFT_535858 [Xylaria intraflava]
MPSLRHRQRSQQEATRNPAPRRGNPDDATEWRNLPPAYSIFDLLDMIENVGAVCHTYYRRAESRGAPRPLVVEFFEEGSPNLLSTIDDQIQFNGYEPNITYGLPRMCPIGRPTYDGRLISRFLLITGPTTVVGAGNLYNLFREFAFKTTNVTEHQSEDGRSIIARVLVAFDSYYSGARPALEIILGQKQRADLPADLIVAWNSVTCSYY